MGNGHGQAILDKLYEHPGVGELIGREARPKGKRKAVALGVGIPAAAVLGFFGYKALTSGDSPRQTAEEVQRALIPDKKVEQRMENPSQYRDEAVKNLQTGKSQSTGKIPMPQRPDEESKYGSEIYDGRLPTLNVVRSYKSDKDLKKYFNLEAKEMPACFSEYKIIEFADGNRQIHAKSKNNKMWYLIESTQKDTLLYKK